MTTLLMTANFGRDDTPAHHQRNIQRVADFAMKYDRAIVLLQEIGEGDHGYNEPKLVAEDFQGFQFAAGRTMTPILIRGFDIQHESIKLASKGIKGVSPHRDVVRLRITRESPNPVELVVFNLHPIQGAFTDPGQILEVQRRKDYMKVWNMATRQAQNAMQAHHSVIWGGDLNNPAAGTMLPGEQVLVHKSLDYLVARQAWKGTKIKLVRAGTIPMSIDGHNAQWAEVELSA